MRFAIAAVLLSACGGAPARKAPVAVVAVPPPSAAPTTCADAAVILRGPVEGEPDAREPGPARVAAITAACEEGKWTAEILHCIGDQADPAPCLDKLADAQRELYDGKLVKWAEQYATETEPPADDAADVYIDCDDALGDVSLYAPAIALTGPDGELATVIRRREIGQLCNTQSWETSVKQCFQAAKDPQATSACEAKLPPDQLNELATRVGEIDALVAATIDKRKHPADCKRVVALHYADAAWKGKLDGYKPADRRKAIAASRTQMAKACATEAWDPTVRSCIVAGGNERCFRTGSFAWGFPASGVIAGSTGIAECDAYVGSMDKVMGCQKIPQQTRDALKDSFTAMRDAVAGLHNADEGTKKQMGESCKYGNDAIKQVLVAAGC